MGRTRNKIPDRWLDFTPCSIQPVPGTKFVCFKTPLKQELCSKFHDKEKWFTISHLLHQITLMGGRLGLVIDLTATDRYYDRNDFEGVQIEHKKIYCPGHEINEREDLVQEFFRTVDSFLEIPQEEENVWIGVHCTHGVNRTGYLVCRYMVERLGFTSEQARNAFSESRQHPIERAHYIESLEYHERRKAENDIQAQNSKANRRSEKRKAGAERNKKHASRKRRRDSDGESSDPAKVMSKMWKTMMSGMKEYMKQQAEQNLVQTQSASDNVASTSGQGDTQEEYEEYEDEDYGDEEGYEEEDYGDGEVEEEVEEVESQEPVTQTQKRRARRRRLEDMFKKMQRGKFWEIREMQKERYGF